MTEEWRDIEGYNGLYRVSNTGRVVSLKLSVFSNKGEPYELSQQSYNGGYKRVYLCNKGTDKQVAVHRLVAKAFIPNPNNYPCVNHKDENPSNNNLNNLEWCTQKYNCNYGTRNKRIKLNMPQNKAVYQLSMDGDIIAEYKTMHEAAKNTGANLSHICSVCKGEREQTSGFKWRYVDINLYEKAKATLTSNQELSRLSRRIKFMLKSKNVAQYTMDGNLIRIYSGTREIEEKFGYKRPCIINCCNKKTKYAYGYKWEYVSPVPQAVHRDRE